MYVSVESGQAMRENIAEGIRTVLAELAFRASVTLGDETLEGLWKRTIAEGLAQTGAYLDRCGAEAGHLIVFDRSAERSWEEKIFHRDAPPGSGAARVTVWGM